MKPKQVKSCSHCGTQMVLTQLNRTEVRTLRVCDLCFPGAVELGLPIPGYVLFTADPATFTHSKVSPEARYFITDPCGQGHKIWFELWPEPKILDEEDDSEVATKLDFNEAILERKAVNLDGDGRPTFNPLAGWYFVKACLAAGWKEEDGWVFGWFLDRCARLIQKHKKETQKTNDS